MSYDTFSDWSQAHTAAIRKANAVRCLVGIRYSGYTDEYSLSLVTKYERHEAQWVTVVEPGQPFLYGSTFIGPYEYSYVMGEAYTCGCGIYVHPTRRNPDAIHIPDCDYFKKEEVSA